MKYMTVDYMSSEQSMSESENGYESPDVERPKKKVFSVSTLPWQSPRQKVNAAKECKGN